jgi:hypothetical protein
MAIVSYNDIHSLKSTHMTISTSEDSQLEIQVTSDGKLVV